MTFGVHLTSHGGRNVRKFCQVRKLSSIAFICNVTFSFGNMEALIGDAGQGDNRRSTLWNFLERPCVLNFPEGPVKAEGNQENASRLPTRLRPRTRLSHERSVSVARQLNATLREATKAIVAQRADRNVQDGETIKSNVRETRAVPQATGRAGARDQATAPEKKASQVRRKPTIRNDAEFEYQCRPHQNGERTRAKKSHRIECVSRSQARRKGAPWTLGCPPPGTYYDSCLSKTAHIYHDVVAGERVFVNYIPDDPCKWESTDDVELSVCQRGVTPSDYADHSGRIIPRYRRHLDKMYRKVLRQVARELRKYVRGKFRTRTGDKDLTSTEGRIYSPGN
ncbi:uncharacterized protein LOC118410234 [Branchiostoma floridae]|uniref:Uncharacterized protein LOC118410234 n=2 Tax=Branchiostoma floridae TaxID=7739 RepID=A0A9J7KPC5_BRAFL|nr:uncharacterized protein LOC118410234 [Branchiostoma floridae]